MLETESAQSETARNFSRLFNESGYIIIALKIVMLRQTKCDSVARESGTI
jgi:hypothetical protein